MKKLLLAFFVLTGYTVSAQTQACPLNNSFSLANLTHWEAYTGLNGNGARDPYDSDKVAPVGTIGLNSITEYGLTSVVAIQILSASTPDPFGGFATVPTINGYKYSHSVLLGSTAISRNGGGGGGGYVRGISYQINVPPGPVTEPYTMTYAYAMVLENGTHNSDQQPLFSATLTTNDSVITCASPKYFLPTDNSTSNGSTGAALDSAQAEAEGFTPSARPSPNENVNNVNGPSGFLRDVWYKGWTEVTFDLSPYRGQKVTLNFEADNCVPGGHFAYAYVALRDVCAGLQISGFSIACVGSTLTYSIPGLTGATYNWKVPPDWTIQSRSDSSVLQVTVGNTGGAVIAEEFNSCADLKDTLPVTTALPTIAGAVTSDAEVCSGINSTPLTLGGNRGNVLGWLASTNNGANWVSIPDFTPVYTAQNLTATTVFTTVVQNSASCDIDTSGSVTVLVDPKSVGGKLSPSTMEFCLGQNKDALLTLNGKVGDVLDWQSSNDGVNWTGFVPVYTDTLYSLIGLTSSTDYRVIVKSGVCPSDTSETADVHVVPVEFPQATAEPADTLICYDTKATLNASISIGTDYSWTNTITLTNQGNGTVPSLPFNISATASPLLNTSYIFTVVNAGCPNPLIDTLLVRVRPPILVNAGNDTTVVVNQPLQLNAVSNDTAAAGDSFTWTPIAGLNNPNIPNPIGIYGFETDSVRYFVTATSPYGCTGVADVLVVVYKTGPDIFVPNAFTPGGPTNSIFRPIPVGISALQFFRVFNRWGQMVFNTSQIGQGWDGRLNGRLVDAGTFVWMVQGTTYTGKTVFHKGTMVLVR